MSLNVDLEYAPDSLLQAVPPDRISHLESWLGRYWERRVSLPKSYVEHVTRHHGGVPHKRFFQTPGGTRAVCRFCNLLRKRDLKPPLLRTWRKWANHDIRLDYSVYSFFEYDVWSDRFQLGRHLLPIAGLDTAGHDCRTIETFDLLCLDLDEPDLAPLVTWCYEESCSDNASVEPVAASFESFLAMLSGTTARNPISEKRIETF